MIDSAISVVKNTDIYDISGRKMTNSQLFNSKFVDVSALYAGMYLLQVETESENNVFKFNKK